MIEYEPLDGAVGLAGLIAIRSRFRTYVGHPGYSVLADRNGDGLILRDDFAEAVRTLGGSSVPAPSQASVPEPSALVLVVVGLMGLIGRRRRRE